MTFEWTKHRFAGGLLALDLVNTVVCRNQPARRMDRFSDPAMITGFCKAASRFRKAEAGGDLSFELADTAGILELREAINDWLRPVAEGRQTPAHAMERLFSAAASSMRARPSGPGMQALGRAAALSAIRLFGSDLEQKVKCCPNCDWLFVDRSKNRSRIWCDMQVCGNRAKAGRYYRRNGGSSGTSQEQRQ